MMPFLRRNIAAPPASTPLNAIASSTMETPPKDVGENVPMGAESPPLAMVVSVSPLPKKIPDSLEKAYQAETATWPPETDHEVNLSKVPTGARLSVSTIV